MKKNIHPFNSGANFGLGIYKLYLSILPAKILRVLSWIGFKGDREEGLRLLHEAASTNTCRAMLSKLCAIAYHYVYQYQFGTVGELNGMSINQSKDHLAQLSKVFPNCVIVQFTQGKQCQIEGQMDDAIHYFTPPEGGWTNFHHFCYWELFWSYGMMGKFKEAAQFAHKLYAESLWSPAVYSWLLATILVCSCSLELSYKKFI